MANFARLRIAARVRLAAAAMFNFTHVLAPIVAAGLVLGFSAGCDDGPGDRIGVIPNVSVPPPAISSITPNIGSTGGSTSIEIHGSGLLPGVTVTLDGVSMTGFLNASRTSLFLTTSPHATGSVDVVLRNLDGQSGSLPGGFTFVPPESFDFNGKWFAFLGNGNDFPFSFLIKSDALVSVTCDDGTTVTFASPVPVVRGEVTATGPTGVIFSGRLVAHDSAVGTIKVGACSSTNWNGWKDLPEGSAGAQSAARRRR